MKHLLLLLFLLPMSGCVNYLSCKHHIGCVSNSDLSHFDLKKGKIIKIRTNSYIFRCKTPPSSFSFWFMLGDNHWCITTSTPSDFEMDDPVLLESGTELKVVKLKYEENITFSAYKLKVKVISLNNKRAWIYDYKFKEMLGVDYVN